MHKTVCIQVLDEMLLYRPPPPFEVHASIKFAYLDQTYLMRGKSAKPSRLTRSRFSSLYIDNDNVGYPDERCRPVRTNAPPPSGEVRVPLYGRHRLFSELARDTHTRVKGL